MALTKASAGLIVRVCDNGVGFVPQSVGLLLAQNHLGLALLEQRVHEMNGTLEIATAPGSGTTVTVTLPLATPQERASEGVRA